MRGIAFMQAFIRHKMYEIYAIQFIYRKAAVVSALQCVSIDERSVKKKDIKKL